MLKSLETKIVEEILPVREKLKERLRNARVMAGAPAAANVGDLQGSSRSSIGNSSGVQFCTPGYA